MNKDLQEDITRLRVLLTGNKKALDLLEDILAELLLDIEKEKKI